MYAVQAYIVKYNPEDSVLHTHRRENLKSHTNTSKLEKRKEFTKIL
jgi:hypothetical protein